MELPWKRCRQHFEPQVGTYTYFMRGATVVGADADDHIVMLQKKKKLQKYDVLLQKFRYGDALDAALASRDPSGVSLLETDPLSYF